jgi:hypothetical protein
VISYEIAEIDTTWDTPAAVVLVFADPIAGLPADARGFEIHRGDRVLPLEPRSNLRIDAIDGARLTLRITHYLGGPLESFFDTRGLAYSNESVIRWADANGDGTWGETDPIRLIVPGRPLESYVIMRLTDPRFGELMPRQCRTWDDDATRALACWIEGLETDATGAITNAYAPIDYEGCDVALPAGRCASVTGTGFAGVEAIVARSCGGMGCHIGEAMPSAGLDLSSGRARESLMAMSTQRPDMRLVAPGDPDASYLLCKLSEACAERGTTARMPLGGALSESDLDVVRAWIAAGAP